MSFKDASDPYTASIPEAVAVQFNKVRDVYKDMGYDLSDIALKGTTRSRYENGAVVPFSVLPEKLQVGASWVPANNSVYFHPDIKAAMKLYGVKGSPDKFIKTLAAHELAHVVDQRYADDAMRKQVLEEARKAKFTTPYLDNLPFEENRDKEIFAEWLASKVVKNDGMGYNSNMQKTANMVGLEKAAYDGLFHSLVGLAGGGLAGGLIGDTLADDEKLPDGDRSSRRFKGRMAGALLGGLAGTGLANLINNQGSKHLTIGDLRDFGIESNSLLDF